MAYREYKAIILLGKTGLDIRVAKGSRMSPKTVKYKLQGYDYNFSTPDSEYIFWIKGKPAVLLFTNDNGKTFTFWKLTEDNKKLLIGMASPDNSHIVREEIINQKRMLSQKEWWQENAHYLLMVIFGFFLLISTIIIYMALKKLEVQALVAAFNAATNACLNKPI